MSDYLLVMEYAFSAMCSFVPCWGIIISSLFPSWIEVSPFLLIGNTHKPVVGSLPPLPTRFFSKIDSAFKLVVDHLHIVSVNTFININDVCDISGTMCARLASLGIQWTSISYVCVDFN